jgi:hypothetical protein
MTEAEWLASESPVALLAHLNADGYSRKLLLYASALCALRPEWLTDTLRDWAAAIEEVLAGDAPNRLLDDWQETAETEICDLAQHGPQEARPYYAALTHLVCCTWITDPLELDFPAPAAAEFAPMRRLGAALVRDIYGNPFRPAAFSPEWRTDTAVVLARQVYESRDFGAMPILADALQDAGCEDADILSHCRDGGPHVRGCWVVDLVLGKN